MPSRFGAQTGNGRRPDAGPRRMRAALCSGQSEGSQPVDLQSARPVLAERGTQPEAAPARQGDTLAAKPEAKRILGIMPNYRAVSAGALAPPPTPREAFKIATQNSFAYSSFAFVGITSLMAWGSDTHPALPSGIAGYGRYYWRGLVDKTDGNYLVVFVLPTVFHQDERCYAKGESGRTFRPACCTGAPIVRKMSRCSE